MKPRRKPLQKGTLWVLLLAAGMGIGQESASAVTLMDDFQRARQHDAGYAASLSEYQTARMQATMAGAAYFPEARYSSTQLANETGDRQTLSINQPLISVDRWLSLQEKEPRLAHAEAVLRKNQYDLASKLYKVVSSISEAREKLRLNQTVVEALEAQTEASKKSFQLGLGTITDVYDSQVRLSQAKSQTLTLQSSLKAAQRQYQTTVGVEANPEDYRLELELSAFKLPSQDSYLDRARAENPSIQASIIARSLGEIARNRSKAVFLPTVVAAAQRSEYAGTVTSSQAVVVRLDIPLDAGSYLKTQTAGLEVQKLLDRERDTRQQVELEVQRLYSDVEASLSEIAIRREAIKAAEQSLNANEQSFIGGVRSKLDVLNALQALHQTKSELITALLQLGERLLGLQVISAVDIDLALRQVQTQLFQP